MIYLTRFACLLGMALVLSAPTSASADTLGDTTNLLDFGVPDILELAVKPYDTRVFGGVRKINGEICCQRDMYRVDGKKIVTLSHQGSYFLVFLIENGVNRMFVAAESAGVFVERPFEPTTTWEIPAWLAEEPRQ
ncbi:MAG: hypothetical protein ACFHX7_16470 [Pseudomonadota bacterium]